MSSRCMVHVRPIKTGAATTKAVLLALGELADDTGMVFRGQQYIADMLEISRFTVIRALQKLEDDGFIRRDVRFWEDSHQRRTDVITIIMRKSHVAESHTEPESHVAEDHMEPESHVANDGDPCCRESHVHVAESHSMLTTSNYLTTNKTTSCATASQSTLDVPIPSKDLQKSERIKTSRKVVKLSEADEVIIDGLSTKTYEATKGAYRFMASKCVFRWAIKAGYAPDAIWTATGNLWRSARPLTQATLGQMLEGVISPGGSVNRPVESTTTQRVKAALDLAEEYRKQGR